VRDDSCVGILIWLQLQQIVAALGPVQRILPMQHQALAAGRRDSFELLV
jgi:hypothetical protein